MNDYNNSCENEDTLYTLYKDGSQYKLHFKCST